MAAGAIVAAVHIPNAEGTEDADIVASEFVQMINEERDRNGTHWQTPDEMVTVSLWPTPQFLTGDQLQDLGALIAELARYREVVGAARAEVLAQGYRSTDMAKALKALLGEFWFETGVEPEPARCEWSVTTEMDDGPLTQRCVLSPHGRDTGHALAALTPPAPESEYP